MDFIGVLSPFKRPENLRWSPYWNFIDRANGEGREARSSSLDQCFLRLMYIQLPGDLAKIQILRQWVWGGVWDPTHLTKLPGDASALDLNLSSKSLDYLLFSEIQLVRAMRQPQPDCTNRGKQHTPQMMLPLVFQVSSWWGLLGMGSVPRRELTKSYTVIDSLSQ